jgi:hypothetical protein
MPWMSRPSSVQMPSHQDCLLGGHFAELYFSKSCDSHLIDEVACFGACGSWRLSTTGRAVPSFGLAVSPCGRAASTGKTAKVAIRECHSG